MVKKALNRVMTPGHNPTPVTAGRIGMSLTPLTPQSGRRTTTNESSARPKI